MDSIFIDRLKVCGILGVYPHERDRPQDILISVTLFTDIRATAESDDLRDSLDYDELAKKLTAHAEGATRFTIEALAEDLARLCLQEKGVTRVILRVEKPDALPAAKSVGVEIDRERSAEK